MKTSHAVAAVILTICHSANCAPSDDSVQRFVQASEVAESTVLGYAATAAASSRAARAKCESQVVLSSRDIFHEWALIATRLVFQHDTDGQELDRITELLETPHGRAFIEAKAQMQRDLTNGVTMAEADSAMRARLSGIPTEMGRPIVRVGEVGKLLSDPRRFQQWPRYNEFLARLRPCADLR